MTWLKNRIHDRFLKRMPVLLAEVVQIAPGDMDFQTIEMWGRNMLLTKIQNRAHSSFTALPHDDWVGFVVPLDWQGAFRVNGCNADRGDVFYVDCSHAYTVACSDARRIVIGVKRDLINRLLVHESGVADPDFLNGSRVLDESAECAQILDASIEQLLSDVPDPEGHPEGLSIPREVEESLIQQMAVWLLDKMKKPTRCWLGQMSAYHTTTKIREALKTRPADASLELADLYDIAGVSKNRLHQCFMEVYGVSPWQYVLKKRLSAARQFLLDPRNSQTPIADTAAKHGFSSSGRFAQKYRNMFDELPSETMKSAKRGFQTEQMH